MSRTPRPHPENSPGTSYGAAGDPEQKLETCSPAFSAGAELSSLYRRLELCGVGSTIRMVGRSSTVLPRCLIKQTNLS